MGKFLIKALVILIIAYVLAMIALFILQRSFMYFPPENQPDLSSTEQDMQAIALTLETGETVPVWWHPPDSEQPVVIFFHGNGSSAYDGRFIYKHFIEQGFGVIAAEYPGYPGATGSPTQRGIIHAALAQYDFIRAKGVTPEQIYLYGTSLGAGVAAQLASRKAVAKIVMEAPFNSMMDMVRLRMPFFAFPPLIKDKYESDKALEGKSVPMLWLHGTHDRVIPIAQGRKLYDSYQGPKQSFIVKGGDHSDLWISGGREAITAFFKS